jgi:opacity protein-like surface antigen
MKKLLVAASVAVGLGAGVVPAFAQSATASQPGWPATANNEAAGSVQAQYYTQSPHYTLSPDYTPSQPAISDGAHVGDGSRPEYQLHQHELQNMPGYSVGGNG